MRPESFRRPAWAAGAFILLAGAAALAAAPRVPAGVDALRGQLSARAQDRDIGQAEARTAREEMVRLRAELAELRALEAAGRGAGGSRQARLAAFHRREMALAAELGRERSRLSRFLGALQLYRRRPPPALLVSPADAKNAVRAAILIRAVEPELARRARVAAMRDEQMRVLRRAAAAANADLFTSESALADRRAELESLLIENANAERRFDAQARAAGREADGLAARLKGLGVSTAVSAADRPPAAMVTPVRGNLLRRFGDRSAAGQRSEGLTWSANPAATVRAPAAGVVEYAGPLKGWGGVLILRLSGGYHLVLAGVEGISVPVGQSVAAGRALGRAPDGGDALPEIYLEVRKDGAPVDPSRWLRTAPARRAGAG